MFCSVVVAMNIYSKTLRKEVLIQKLLQWELNAIPLFLCPPVVGEENYGNGKGEPVQMLRDRTNNTLKLQANQISMMCVEQILSFVWEIQFTNSSLFRRMALAMKGAQLVKQANFAPAAIQHFNYSSEVRIQYAPTLRGNVTYICWDTWSLKT